MRSATARPCDGGTATARRQRQHDGDAGTAAARRRRWHSDSYCDNNGDGSDGPSSGWRGDGGGGAERRRRRQATGTTRGANGLWHWNLLEWSWRTSVLTEVMS